MRAMSELAPDAVGETHAAPDCIVEDCTQPGLYQGRCRDHLDVDPIRPEVADSDEADDDTERVALADGGDPKDFTVHEVVEYLKTLPGADDPEYLRILELEASADGKGRTGILGN